MSRDIEFDLRNDYFARLERQPPASSSDHPTGDLMARATNDLAGGAHALRAGHHVRHQHAVHRRRRARSSWPASTCALTLLALVTMPLVAVATKLFGERIHPSSSACRSSSRDALGAGPGEPRRRARGARLRPGGARGGRVRRAQRRATSSGNRRLIRWSRGVPPAAPGADRRRLRGRALVRRPAGAARPRSRVGRVRHLQPLPRQAGLADDRDRLGDQPGAARRGLARPHPRDPRRPSRRSATRSRWSIPAERPRRGRAAPA